MRHTDKKSKLDEKELLRRSPNINKKTVAAHERLEQQLLKLGGEIKSSYSLDPPLGRSGAALLLHRGR